MNSPSPHPHTGSSTISFFAAMNVNVLSYSRHSYLVKYSDEGGTARGLRLAIASFQTAALAELLKLTGSVSIEFGLAKQTAGKTVICCCIGLPFPTNSAATRALGRAVRLAATRTPGRFEILAHRRGIAEVLLPLVDPMRADRRRR